MAEAVRAATYPTLKRGLVLLVFSKMWSKRPLRLNRWCLLKYCDEWPYELSFLPLFILPCAALTYPLIVFFELLVLISTTRQSWVEPKCRQVRLRIFQSLLPFHILEFGGIFRRSAVLDLGVYSTVSFHDVGSPVTFVSLSVNVEVVKTTVQRPNAPSVQWKISCQETKYFLSLKTLPQELWKFFLER